jgi:uncharacterized protein (TIGR02217 family)
MKNFIDYQFPKEISYGSVGGSAFLTDIIETSSGYEQRNIKRMRPRARYNVAIGIRHQKDLEDIRALHLITQGRVLGFRYQDPLDYQVNQGFIGNGDEKSKKFQLIKRYHINNLYFYDRQIVCPVKESIQVYMDNVLQSKNWSLGSKGIIIFKSPPYKGTIISASFEFDVPVRFDCDYLPQRLDNYNIASIVDIQLIEILT